MLLCGVDSILQHTVIDYIVSALKFLRVRNKADVTQIQEPLSNLT
jgi:hypothetical protein